MQQVCKLSSDRSIVGWVAILDNVRGVYTAELQGADKLDTIWQESDMCPNKGTTKAFF